MWSKIIYNTLFSTPAANSVFENRVRLCTYDGDVTFVSTLRAIMKDRLPEGEALYFEYVSYRYASNFIDEYSVPKNSLVIVNLRRAGDDLKESLNALESIGFQFVDKVEEFFKKSFRVLLYVRPETKTSLLFVPEMNINKYHLLQCAIPAFLPWYFPPEKPVEDWEMKLFKSCQNSNPDEYLKILGELALQCDFDAQYIREALNGFEARGLEQKLKSVNEEIESYIREINRMYERIQGFLENKRDSTIKALGLKSMIDNAGENPEIANYFIRSKYLKLIDVNGEWVRFVVRDQLRFWGSEVGGADLDAEYDKPNSFLYRPKGNLIPESKEVLEKFWRAIFDSQKISIKMYAAYALSTTGVNLDRLGYGWRDDALCNGYIFNPHIYYHCCMGNYIRPIQQSLDNGDFIGAIEHCITSARSINLDEVGPTIGPWIWDLYNSVEKCIVLPNGDEVTCKEAIKWVKEGGLD